MQHTTSSRRAPRAALFWLALALAGCTDLGLPSEPSYTFDDASGACSAGRAGGTVRASVSITREERRVERTGCGGAMRGGARQPAKK